LLLVDALVEQTTVFPSKTEARKMIQGNALALNKTKVSDVNTNLTLSDFIADTYLLISKGKKENYLVKIV